MSRVSVLLLIILAIVLGSLDILILIVSLTPLSFVGSRVATALITPQW